MLLSSAELTSKYSFSKRVLISCAASIVLIATPIDAQSNVANQRFLDNALQFDDDEGLRTRSESPGLGAAPVNQSAGVIVVTESATQRKEAAKPKARGGFSFSDMAKSTQQTSSQRSGLSFGDMAKSARRPKPRLQLTNKTQKVPTSARVLLPR